MIDRKIADALQQAGVDTVMSVPCNLLAGILREIDASPLRHVPVCREEEGVGIAAGIALGGGCPVLLMQNSGLGNTINALLSLTRLYELPLVMVMTHRGGPGEPITAQVPMGQAVPRLLATLDIPVQVIAAADDVPGMVRFMRTAYARRQLQAVLLQRELWNAAQ